MVLLFLHGAGGHDEDRTLANAIAADLGQPLEYPRLPEDDMSVEHQARFVRAALDAVAPDDFVVAHSFGATMLLHILAEHVRDAPRRVTLLAMPDWSPEGWDVADYAFTGPEPTQAISLHHCRDDEVVEFAHLALNVRGLPHAARHAHDSGGHQFTGLAPEIAHDLRALRTAEPRDPARSAQRSSGDARSGASASPRTHLVRASTEYGSPLGATPWSPCQSTRCGLHSLSRGKDPDYEPR